MINKFKDFLKKFKRQNSEDLPDEEFEPNDYTNPEYNLEGDYTGEVELSDLKPSIKSKIQDAVSNFTSKIKRPRLKEWKTPEGVNFKSDKKTILLSRGIGKSIENLLSKQGRETIHQFFLVFIISAITYTSGKFTALVLKTPPTLDAPSEISINLDHSRDFKEASLTQVRSINIFRTNAGLIRKKTLAEDKCNEGQQKSKLPIKLINTVVLQDSVKSLASVQVRGERILQEVREGEQISNLAKIFKISRLEMVIKNLENGMCESISSDKAKESRSPISVMSPSQSKIFKASKKMVGIENIGNTFNIAKNLLDEKMKDISSILTQTRAVKIQNPDGSMSFKLTEMDPEGLFPFLGLQDQDIITSINGKPIYDMNEVMGLFGKIKNLDKLQLGIKRDGSESVLDYNIKK